MENIVALLVVALTYYIGEFVGVKTKAWIPSVFVTAVLFLVGYWTFFPQDIVVMAGLGPPLGGLLVILLCIAHMGTTLSIKQLIDQWKVVAISLAGIAGMVALAWIIARPIVGKEYVIAGLPSLAGGIVAATIMNEAAMEAGLTTAAILAIAMYSIQGFVGYPLTSIMLKMEGKKLLEDYSKMEKKDASMDINEDSGLVQEKETRRSLKFVPSPPGKYVTPAFIIFKLMVTAYISNRLGAITGLNQAVWALILGIVLTEIGFLDKDSLNKAKSYGFLMFILMVYIFSGLKDATPEILGEAIVPLIVIIITGVTGLAIMSILVGKILKVNWNMAFAVSLTALYGFPPNAVITEEVCTALAKTPEEKDYLMGKMLPMMLVGGFTTVTITSVVLAGVFAGML
ncbi:MAG TPA: hypothetical protein VFC79_14485 [Tissierellaceae bacterium]|nr:hypothetical protein [Tissierellaceae bacterium]